MIFTKMCLNGDRPHRQSKGRDRSGVRMLVGNALVGSKRAGGGGLTSSIATRLPRNVSAHVLSTGVILVVRPPLGYLPTRQQWNSLVVPLRLDAPSQHVLLTGGVTREGG